MNSAVAASTLPVLCLGEALVDIVERDGVVEGEYVGGSPYNVACGLSRLDHDADLACWVGDDERGRAIEAGAAANGLTLVDGCRGARRTSTAKALLDANGSATYDFDLDWELPSLGALDRYAHLHTGSIAATLEPGGTQVVGALRAVSGRATISYDPNARPGIMGSPEAVLGRIEDIIGLSDVVKASDEDIAWLYPGQDADDVLRRWLALGPSLVVMTRGGEGARVLLGDGTFHDVAPRKVQLVDTVGAGDSFMAGMLSGLLDAGLLGSPEAAQRLRGAGWDEVSPALERATATSGATVERAGAHAPTRDQAGV